MYVGVAVRGRFGGSLAAWSCFRFRGLQYLLSLMLLVLGAAYFRIVSGLLAAGSVGKDSDPLGELSTSWLFGVSIAAVVSLGLRIDQSLSIL